MESSAESYYYLVCHSCGLVLLHEGRLNGSAPCGDCRRGGETVNMKAMAWQPPAATRAGDA